MVVYIVGYMYSGKSTYGRTLAERLGYDFVDLDHMIEERYHSSIGLIFQHYGEAAFRKMEQEELHKTGEMENVVVATGGGTPCYGDNMDYILEHGTSIYIKQTTEKILERQRRSRKQRPLLAQMSDAELEAYVRRQMEEREVYYRRADYVV